MQLLRMQRNNIYVVLVDVIEKVLNVYMAIYISFLKKWKLMLIYLNSITVSYSFDICIFLKSYTADKKISVEREREKERFYPFWNNFIRKKEYFATKCFLFSICKYKWKQYILCVRSNWYNTQYSCAKLFQKIRDVQIYFCIRNVSLERDDTSYS